MEEKVDMKRLEKGMQDEIKQLTDESSSNDKIDKNKLKND